MTPTTNPTIDEICWKDSATLAYEEDQRWIAWRDSLPGDRAGSSGQDPSFANSVLVPLIVCIPAAYIAFYVTATLVASHVSVVGDHGGGLMIGAFYGLCAGAVAVPVAFHATRRWLSHISLGYSSLKPRARASGVRSGRWGSGLR